jgi:hypothetical protein
MRSSLTCSLAFQFYSLAGLVVIGAIHTWLSTCTDADPANCDLLPWMESFGPGQVRTGPKKRNVTETLAEPCNVPAKVTALSRTERGSGG